MDIFDVSEEIKVKEERESVIKAKLDLGQIQFSVIYAKENYSEETQNYLLKAKELLQVQLPKMPREYILKQIFDEKHRTLCMFYEDDLIGVICFRPFYENNFTEMVFLAINFNSQIKGNGSFMVYVFKEYFKFSLFNFKKGLKNEEESITFVDVKNISYTNLNIPIYIMTYADNSAIGFFKKQGFTSNIKFDKWVGQIKDYEGGTLVECRVFWEINYITNLEIINEVRDKLFSKIKNVEELKIKRGPISKDNLEILSEIPFFKNKFIFKDNKIVVPERKKSKEAVLYDFLNFLLADLCNNVSAWPFLKPVDPHFVPDYYKVIKKPMDLSTMEEKLKRKIYLKLDDFENDFYLMISNCYHYNSANTQYYKCAQNFESYFCKKIQNFKNCWFLKKDD